MVTEDFAPYGPYQTWYRIIGDLHSGKPPLFVLHGGPGCTHDYVDSFKGLAARGRAVIHYDQIGNGRSTHLRDKGANFWTPDFFKAELSQSDRLSGRALGLLCSWPIGGRHSRCGVRRDAPSRPQGAGDRQLARLDGALDQRGQSPPWRLAARCAATLLAHEAAGSTDSKEYTQAMKVFYERHVCRVVPMPDEVARTFKAIEEDPTAYHTMNGPSEFHVIGTLSNWSIIDRLTAIDVATLLISGRHDEATPATVQPYADTIPGARWHIFEDSSHMPHVEETAACLKVVGDFLEDADERATGRTGKTRANNDFAKEMC